MHILNYQFSYQRISIIARQKLAGGGDHWGVQLANNYVFHITEDRGMQVVKFEEFAAGRAVRVVKEIPPEENAATIHRIKQELASPTQYHLLTNNCEIVANRVTGHIPESPQVKGWIAILTMIGLVATIARAA